MTGCWVFVDGLLLLLLTIYALHLLRYTRQIPTGWLRIVSERVSLNLPSAALQITLQAGDAITYFC